MKKISKTRKQEIIELAEGISSLYFQDYPIDPELIAKANDISVSYNYYPWIDDGLLEYENGLFHIFLNLKDGATKLNPRVRFSFCHELGHFNIPEHRRPMIEGRVIAHSSIAEFASSNLAEFEADCFASYLLMPTYILKKSARKLDKGLPGIVELAKLLNTSITSTSIRYIELNIVPCLMIKWNPDGSSWCRYSESFSELYLGTPIRNISNVVSGCATLKVANSGSNKIEVMGSTANFWFPKINNAINRNTLLFEQAISLGKYGLLTILIPDL